MQSGNGNLTEKICGFEIEIFRKKNRNIIIRVDGRGKIKMTVPFRVSMERARKFVGEKAEWIEEKVRLATSARETDSEDAVYYFGQRKTVKKNFGKRGVTILGDEIEVSADDESATAKEIAKFLKSELLKKSRVYFDKWHEITGLKPSGVGIRASVTRWGSCNHRSGKINLSLYLANLPEKCLDYVVLHELAHLVYNDHGKGFKNFLTEKMPEWRDTEKYLKTKANALRFIYN